MAQTSRPCKGCGEPIYRTVSVAPIPWYHGPECRPSCDVEDCTKPRHGDFYCSTHHSRWRKYGDPLAPLVRSPNIGECSVEGCDQPMRKRTWCAAHYAQWKRSGEVRPFAYKWADELTCEICGAPNGTYSSRKFCSDSCKQAAYRSDGARPKTAVCDYCNQEFSLSVRTATGRLQRLDTKWCPDCGRDSPDVQRFRRYGITREQYEQATAKGCLICGATDRKLHVDHDHSCCPSKNYTCGECVRGLICGLCNRGLGSFDDNPDALMRAASYLISYLNNGPRSGGGRF